MRSPALEVGPKIFTVYSEILFWKVEESIKYKTFSLSTLNRPYKYSNQVPGLRFYNFWRQAYNHYQKNPKSQSLPDFQKSVVTTTKSLQITTNHYRSLPFQLSHADFKISPAYHVGTPTTYRTPVLISSHKVMITKPHTYVLYRYNKILYFGFNFDWKSMSYYFLLYVPAHFSKHFY